MLCPGSHSNAAFNENAPKAHPVNLGRNMWLPVKVVEKGASESITPPCCNKKPAEGNFSKILKSAPDIFDLFHTRTI